ncbi:MAG: hypothetical protein ACYC6N_14235 [Pirellulaceae bacterium]
MAWETFRLARLSLAAKLMITLLLLIIGPGYLFGMANIFFKHQNADGEPGLTIDDLRATFHGLTKTFQPEDKKIVNSLMLKQVRPGGDMREYLDQGGEPAVRGLITWLENSAKEDEFAKPGLANPADPSAQQIIKAHCVECHNADGGDMEDVPYAATAESEPEYTLVMVTAKPEITIEPSGLQTLVIKPASDARLVHVTHAHVMTVPIFIFIVGVLFLMTGIPQSIKLLLGPLPLLAVLLDISSWWIARYVEPFIFVIAATGAVLGATYALQIVCVLGSMWFGRRTAMANDE